METFWMWPGVKPVMEMAALSQYQTAAETGICTQINSACSYTYRMSFSGCGTLKMSLMFY